MSDEDWRVEVELADSDTATRLHTAIAAGKLVRHAREELAGRAVLSRDDNLIFAYATTRENAQAAEQALRDVVSDEHLDATFSLKHFHEIAERWEDPDVPLPTDATSVAAERAEAREAEQADSDAAGIPEYEVRLTLATRREAIDLAERLQREGMPSLRHWRYLLLGAWTEADAEVLADRLRSELPEVDLRIEETSAYQLQQNPNELRVFAAPFVLF
jgi:hypothetical protein